MQISDLLGQYNHAATAGAEKVTGTKGVENLVSTLQSLTKGNIFEGTVSSMKNGRVTLALSNGTQVSARMEGKVSLSVGQSMFFQVKSNDGSQIAIRPFVVDGNGVNFTLLQALSAAGLPTQANYLSMVDTMMGEQMPIDRSSLQQMARLANAHGDIDVRTLVQMSKLGIEITPENAAQFENYLGDKQAITAAIDNFIDEFPMAMQGSSLAEGGQEINAKVLAIITEGLPEVVGESAGEAAPEAGHVMEETIPQNGESNSAGVNVAEAGKEALPQNSEGILHPIEQPVQDSFLHENLLLKQMPQTEAATEIQEEDTGLAQKAEVLTEVTPAEHTLAAVLDSEQLTNLKELLGQLVGRDQVEYPGEKSVAGLLKDLQELLKSNVPIDREGLNKLLSSKEFKSLVRDVLEQQWTVKPEELTGSDKINRLYEKLDSQMERISNVLKATGQENVNFTQTAADIRSNVEFMNQINQVYTYVQLPLKMSGQNVSAELYVYTNKKALAEGNRELTAFLHLDMDNLGPTDVSVKLLGREVSTNFYLENDEAYALIERHLPILEERLEKKGYNCKIAVINETKHVNFVEDFLKKDQPSAGQLHRYSFDMKA